MPCHAEGHANGYLAEEAGSSDTDSLTPCATPRPRSGCERGSTCAKYRSFSAILNNEKYIGRLVWNRSTWPRDPERDGKQVRRELPIEEWVVQDAPGLQVLPSAVTGIIADMRQMLADGRI